MVEVGGLGGACGLVIYQLPPPATCYHHNALLKVHIHSKCKEKGGKCVHAKIIDLKD